MISADKGMAGRAAIRLALIGSAAGLAFAQAGLAQADPVQSGAVQVTQSQVTQPQVTRPHITPAQGAATLQILRDKFVQPPGDARPWTWFHVMSGNMSREGITKDLEALERAGVGGIVLFHVTQGIPHGTVRFNSPEHLDLITHAAAECERLGLAFNFHNSDGWSSSGGPWVTPEQSMKRLIWTETLVDGGVVKRLLAQPAARAGLYRDVAVIAYPALKAEKVDAMLHPVVTASDPGLDIALATDGNRDTMAKLSIRKGERGWVQFSYDAPVSIRSLLFENSPTRGFELTLESSQDGQTWDTVKTFETRRIGKFDWMVDDSFAAVTARHFRVSSKASVDFGEIKLSTIPLIPDVTLHTSMAQGTGLQLPAKLDAAAETLIDPKQIIDLTASLDASGRINARLPAGQWTIMRFGYTSTGATNVIASPEGTGLEVDKFSPQAFRAFYKGFIGPVLDRARAVAPTATTGVMIDSYEVGGQNWTDGYERMFAEKFGQPVVKWLPIYTGRLVSSAEETRDMLEGIRSFNADLMRDNYYGVFADMMRREKLESLVQPYGMGAFDNVDIGSTASVPTGEFWMGRPSVQLNEAVSAGHLYGKKMIAAEAFTAVDAIHWRFSPALGKKWGDRAWVAGINQFMFHRFAHQANTHVMPGMTMNRYGSHFDRTQPWWDQGGKAWFEYMARGHYLLRQGLPVVDIALYTGGDNPVGCQEKTNYTDRLPAGVEYDCLNEETLLSRSRFVDGQLELPNGGRYAMIWWPHNRPISAAVEARMAEAKAAGVPVALAHQGDDPKSVFTKSGLSPRIIGNGPLPMFTQRRIGATDIFFLLNFEEADAQYDMAFDVRGHAPELWNPVTGEMTPLPATIDADGRTRVKLGLLAGQSAFVIFDPAHRLIAAAPVVPGAVQAITGPWSITFDPLYSDAGTITVPGLTDLSKSSDTEIRNFSGKAVYRKAFSWTGGKPAADAKVMLDLGQVEVAATVRLNGVELGTLWTAPYAIDISKAIRPGENRLEVEVANLWVNRLIGDAGLEDTSGFVTAEREPSNNMVAWYSANQPLPPGPRRTFTTQSFFKPNDPLVASGLIGPVRILTRAAAK